jgi:preprotein translocase SecE subunit
MNIISFLGEVKTELTKVTPPTKKDVIRLTVTVIGISIFAGIYLGAADFLFIKMLELIIK